MFFHTNSIRELKIFIHSWGFTTIVIIIIGVKEGGDSEGEKQLMFANGKEKID